MTKLPSNDGVACDLCGLQLKNKFVYYNYDLVKTYIVNKFQPSILGTLRKPELQLDVCGNCNSGFSDDVVKNNTLKQKMAFCELTGSLLDNGPAYIIFVSEIFVDIENKSVKTDKNYLSFVISQSEKSRFNQKPIGSWETKS